MVSKPPWNLANKHSMALTLLLTHLLSSTQLQRETGADVTTRGKYYTDRSEATEKDPPLYLHITAVTQEALDLAVKKITEMIDQAQSQGPLPPQRESFQGPPPRSYGYGGPPVSIENETCY